MGKQGSDFSTGGHTNLCAGVVREGERGGGRRRKREGESKKEVKLGGNSSDKLSLECCWICSFVWMSDRSDEGTLVVHGLL